MALSSEVVETSVPAYAWSGFCDHQLRWFRTVRDARPGGYAGSVCSRRDSPLRYLECYWPAGSSPVSLWILALSFFLRLTFGDDGGHRSPRRSLGAAKSLWLSAGARPRGFRPMDRGFCGQHDCVARRTLHGETRQVEQSRLGSALQVHCSQQWRIKLFFAERDHGIDSHCASSRNRTRCERDKHQQYRNTREGGGIIWPHTTRASWS